MGSSYAVRPDGYFAEDNLEAISENVYRTTSGE
jgi:hypothetical protein